MNCSEARAAIGPDPPPTSSSRDPDEATEHYQQCDACQRFYASQNRLANRLKMLNSAQAPPGLRDRVVAALDQETDRQRAAIPTPSRRRWVAAVALAAAAAATAIWFATRPETALNPAHQAAIILAAIPHDSTTADSGLASDDPYQLRNWLAPRIGASVEIPEIPNAYLTGGQVTQLDGVPTAAVHYQYHGKHLMYFLIPASKVSRRMPKDDDLWSFTAGGYEVVLWRDGATTRAVMAPLARPELEAIAELCRIKTTL